MKKHTLGWIDGRQSLIRLVLGCLVLTSSLLYSPHSFALTLEQAKQQGRVGETLSGYLAPVKKDAETLALVEQINLARAEKYQEVAQKKPYLNRECRQIGGAEISQPRGGGRICARD